MIVAKLSISYDRGTVYNKKDDVGANVQRGEVAADGGIVRGLGSRFRSKEAMEAAQARDKEAYRVYKAFRERFLTTTIDGLYIVQSYGEAKAFVSSLQPVGIDVRVAEFELTANAGLDVDELGAWGDRIKRQLCSVGLGRKKDVDADGIKALKALSLCPLISKETGEAIRDMVSLLETGKVNRTEFRTRLEKLNVKVEQLNKKHEENVAALDKGVAFAEAPVAAVHAPEVA